MTALTAADDVARLVMRAPEVMGAGKHVWNLHPQVGAKGAFIASMDDLAKTAVPGARSGQPIGIFRSADGIGFDLVPLDARRKGAAMATAENYPQVGGLTLQFESIRGLGSGAGDSLVGLTALTPRGSIGKVHPANVVPRSAVMN